MTKEETVDLGEVFAKIYDGDDEEEMDWATTDYTNTHPDCCTLVTLTPSGHLVSPLVYKGP